MNRLRKIISKSQSRISFLSKGGGSWKVWDRYLAIDGKEAFHIGNVCETCSFFFERIEGTNKSIKPKELIDSLNYGLKSITPQLVEQLSLIIPEGDYWVFTSRILPTLVVPGEADDYFVKEQVDTWGMGPPGSLSHDPKTEYYRLRTVSLPNRSKLFEFLIPLLSRDWLNQQRVTFYREEIGKGSEPTAISIAVLDVKEPATIEPGCDPENCYSHWCLANYLIDGHHKVFAAAMEGKSITMITFLAVDRGVSSEEDVEKYFGIIDT